MTLSPEPSTSRGPSEAALASFVADRGTEKKSCYLAEVAAVAAAADQKPAVHVAVTRAGSDEALPLLYMVASGLVFGRHQGVVLRVTDKVQRYERLRAQLLQLQACAFNTLRGVELTRSMRVLLKDAHAVFLLPRRVRFASFSEERQVRCLNYHLFKEYGLALRAHGSATMRVVCLGPHGCVMAALCALLAEPTVPEKHVTAVSRVEEARARSLVAERMDPRPPAGAIANVVVWGHPHVKCVADLRFAMGPDGNVGEMIGDVKWARAFLSQPVRSAVDDRPLPLAGAWALAAARHLRAWWRGTARERCAPMCVPSDGAYEVPPHMYFAFPVVVTPDREWHILKDLPLDTFTATIVRDAVQKQRRQLRHALVTLLRARLEDQKPHSLPSVSSEAMGEDHSWSCLTAFYDDPQVIAKETMSGIVDEVIPNPALLSASAAVDAAVAVAIPAPLALDTAGEILGDTFGYAIDTAAVGEVIGDAIDVAASPEGLRHITFADAPISDIFRHLPRGNDYSPGSDLPYYNPTERYSTEGNADYPHAPDAEADDATGFPLQFLSDSYNYPVEHPADTSYSYPTDTDYLAGSSELAYVGTTDTAYPADATDSAYPVNTNDAAYPLYTTDTAYPMGTIDSAYPIDATDFAYPADNTNTAYPADISDMSYAADTAYAAATTEPVYGAGAANTSLAADNGEAGGWQQN